jgi:mannose-6-phosphate isomerase-like protein (cupin superfamily)
MDTKTIFNEFARTFERKIDKDYYIKVQLEITDEKNGIWQIDVKDGKVSVYNEEKIEPEETFVLSKETLLKLYNNELNTYTARLQEPKGFDEVWALIDFKNKSEEKRIASFQESSEHYKFLCRSQKFDDFFSKDYPTKIIVDYKNSVKHDHVHTIALHFGMGKSIYHGYFSLEKNEKKYWPPSFEYGFYVLSGKGTITISDEKFNICAKEYYYLTPKKGILVENQNEEHLEILFLCDDVYKG